MLIPTLHKSTGPTSGLRLLLILTVISVIHGCATPRHIYTIDGKEEFRIDCSGTMLDWEECYERARDICGKKGYDVVSKSNDRGSMNSRHLDHADNPSIVRRMTIACK